MAVPASQNWNPWLALMKQPPDPQLAYNEEDLPGAPPSRMGPPRSAMMPPPFADLTPPPAPAAPAMAPGQTPTGPKIVTSPGAAARPPASEPQSPVHAAGSPSSTAAGAGQPVRPPNQTFQSPVNPLAFGPTMKAQLSALLPEIDDKRYMAPLPPQRDPLTGQQMPTPEGRKTTAHGEEKVGDTAKITQAIPEGAFQTALGRVINGGLPGLDLERKDVKNMRGAIEGLIDQERRKGVLGSLNLMPLFGLSDAWWGGNLAKTYVPPVSGKKLIADLGKTLSDAENHLSANEIAMLKSQLGDQFQQNLLATLGGSRQFTEGGGAGGLKFGDILGLLRYQQTAQNQAVQQQDKAATAGKDYIKGMDEAGVGRMMQALQGIDQILGKQQSGENPGFLENKDLGKAGDMLPHFSVQLPNALRFSKDAQDLGRYNETLLATITQRYSGKAVTDREVTRKAQELGQKLNQGPEEYKAALRDLVAAVQAAEKARRAAFLQTPGAKVPEDAWQPEDLNGLTFSPRKEAPGAGAEPPAPSEATLKKPAKPAKTETLEEKKARLKRELNGK